MCSWKQCLPLSNTSAQRPEVQGHWPSTQMTRAAIFDFLLGDSIFSGPPVVNPTGNKESLKVNFPI